MIVIDTSVFVDFFIEFEAKRHKIALEFMEEISSKDAKVFAPFVLEIELAGVLSRFLSNEEVLEICNYTRSKVNLVAEELIHEEAFEIAIKADTRAIDAYFIAVSQLYECPLVSNDKRMVENSRKLGIKSFYLIDSWNKAELKKKLEKLF